MTFGLDMSLETCFICGNQAYRRGDGKNVHCTACGEPLCKQHAVDPEGNLATEATIDDAVYCAKDAPSNG